LDKNLHLVSIPVDYRDRPEGSVSKLSTYTDGIKVLKTIFNLYKDYRPLSFFGLFAALFALVGVGMFIPVLVEYIRTGLVPRFPTLIVSTVLIILAMLALVCGLVLETVAKKHRQQFEVELNIIQMLHKRDS